jgi:chromosome segregation protein
MIIKRVVIQGFKTFAKRTEFVFDPGVTAIVGPNGSGKSNVADAVRWCLGEQSFSLLRSKKSSDIIFSGSDQKARLGMAQVSLTLDNSAGDLPIDFIELEITRRAYRDGDNEYLLNGQRVRLQDLTDLLAQTGLGRRTYALIGQGLIDKVLSLAPDELRSLFEEAAGITGYQTKRATTLRRLEATQQNLTRVQDIVTELSPRLGYLRKQAERAREREQIANDLRFLLRDWYGYHWHSTLQQVAQHHAAAGLCKGRVEASQRALTGLARQIEQLRTRQGAARGQLGDLHRESSRLHREAEQAGRDLAVAQERMRQLQDRQEEAHRDLAPMRLHHETVAARLTGAESALARAKRELDERQAAVDAMQQALDQRRHVRVQLQEALKDARRQTEQHQAAHTETASHLRRLAERQASLAQEQEGQNQSRAETASRAAQVERALAAEETQLRALEARLVTAQETIATLEANREALRAKLETARQERQHAERDLDRLQTRHELLQRLQHEGAGYASGVRAVLQAARHTERDPLRGVLGTVASLIQTPSHLDKALETALGAALQNIITERWSDAQAAIEWLKRTGHGRATFLPLDRLVVPTPLSAPPTAGILGNAAELVAYDPKFANAVHQLLNRVWVAQTLPAARAALDALGSGVRPTVVTLDGDIVRPGGAVTGGSDLSRRDESILARERELRELPAQLTIGAAKAAGASDHCRQLAAEVEEIGIQLAPRQEEVSGLIEQERAQRSRIEDIRRQLESARQAEQWLSERIAQLGQEAREIAGEQTRLDGLLAALVADLDGAQATVRAAENAVEEAGDGELLRQFADLRTAAVEAQAAWQSQMALMDAQRRTLQSTAEQISAKEEQLARLTTDSTALTDRLATLTAQAATLSKTIAELQSRIDPAERALDRMAAEQARLEQQERTDQETLRKEESAWTIAQLQLQRSEDQLRGLRHNIEQDLGLVLLEIGEELAYQPPLPWDSIVEQLRSLDELPVGLEEEIREMRARLSRVSNVNPDAPREYAEATERHDYLLTQSKDLEAAIADLRKVLRELDEVMRHELQRTFAAVSEQFVEFFQQLFNGGTAKLVLVDPEDIANSGIEIIARPPGKRPQNLSLLSGGERTLAACALIFAILRVSPTPFCVLDEVDAALDEANVDRFRQAVDELSTETQFILITHNRRTLEGTNAIYGVTMAADGASRIISLQLDGDRVIRRQEGADAATEDADPDVAAFEELVKM